MELNAPVSGVCPICEDEEVTYQLNKGGKPYFTCRGACSTTVNLHGGDEIIDVLEQYVDDEQALSASDPDADDADVDVSDDSDDEGESKPTSLNDVLNNDESEQ